MVSKLCVPILALALAGCGGPEKNEPVHPGDYAGRPNIPAGVQVPGGPGSMRAPGSPGGAPPRPSAGGSG
jgi:hypothetical protein